MRPSPPSSGIFSPGATRLVLIAGWAWLGLPACGEPPPPPPSAVISVEPEAIPAGVSTTLAFDASKSTARLTLVPAPSDPDDGPLTVRWSFAGGVERGPNDATAERVEVVASGDRPVHATLSVENRWGGRVTTLKTVPLLPGGSSP